MIRPYQNDFVGSSAAQEAYNAGGWNLAGGEGHFGGAGCAARELVNRLTAGDFSLRLAEVCWLRLFLEESI